MVYVRTALMILDTQNPVKFQDSQLRMRINIKPIDNQEWGDEWIKLRFCWYS